MNTNVEVGSYLARLRSQAGIRQSELATRLTFSTTLVSRVESGDRDVTGEELHSILDAIGTEEAMRFRETMGRNWQHLPRPPLGHPEEDIVWNAELAFGRVQELANAPDTAHPFARRLEESLAEIRQVAELVLAHEYSIAFVGDIGVGKSTAICRISDLETYDEATRRTQPVLDAGAGGITLCEVQIAEGPGYGLLVEPRSEAELYTEIREFARSFVESSDSRQSDDEEEPGFAGTSREVQRVIRNMSGSTIKRTTLPDGKRTTTDPVRLLAAECTNADDLAVAIRARMNLHNRTRREIWRPDSTNLAPLSWLAEHFSQVNNGRHAEFSLPRRIEVVLPKRILGSATDGVFSIRLIDTRGIDSTAERADLEAHLGDPSAIVVMCSLFNSAPSASVQVLLDRAVRGGFPNIKEQAAVLVLPRPNEAMAVRDDEGFAVESPAEGYELKGEQAANSLASNRLPNVPLQFFNAHEDDPDGLIAFLVGLIKRRRKAYVNELRTVVDAANVLVDNHADEQIRAVQRQAAGQLLTCIEAIQAIGPLAIPPERSLLKAIRQMRYASSLHASIRRRGEWHNLEYAHQLSYGARVMAVEQVQPKLVKFRAVAENLINTPELEAATGLVEQSLRMLESGYESVLRDCELLGRTIYAEEMASDPELWAKCEREWGRGSGYCERVHAHHENWFDNRREQIDARVNAILGSKWQELVERISSILETD